MEKVKVSREIAEVLDNQSNTEWAKQFNLIGHCKSFSENGICIRSNYLKEFEILNTLQPLEYAKCLIIGYEVEGDDV